MKRSFGVTKYLSEKLSRVTVSEKFIPEIDGLRFVAIATVVLYHLRTSVLRFGDFNEQVLSDDVLFQVLSKGGLGVNLFFTISGFILALPFLRQLLYNGKIVSIRKYFLRRISRLEPPYILIMTVLFAGLAVASSGTFAELFPHYIASVFYVHYFFYGTWSTINPVAWSLETEVQFYILAPLLAFVFKLRQFGMRIVLYIIILIIHTYFITYNTDLLEHWHLSKSIAYYFNNFFIGFILADLFLKIKFNERGKHHINDVIGVGALIGLFHFYLRPGAANYMMFYTCTMLLIWGAFTGRFLNRILGMKFITVIGGMCYTIYLVHYVFLFLIIPLFTPVFVHVKDFYLVLASVAVVTIPLLLIFSAVIFYFLERPFMFPDWYRGRSLINAKE